MNQQEQEMQIRQTDQGVFQIDRKIPLPWLVGIVVAIAGQAAIIWNGQQLQAAEMRHQAIRIEELSVEVKTMNASSGNRESRQSMQELKLDELERRVSRLETAGAITKENRHGR